MLASSFVGRLDGRTGSPAAAGPDSRREKFNWFETLVGALASRYPCPPCLRVHSSYVAARTGESKGDEFLYVYDVYLYERTGIPTYVYVCFNVRNVSYLSIYRALTYTRGMRKPANRLEVGTIHADGLMIVCTYNTYNNTTV